jgi:hypothetical protein
MYISINVLASSQVHFTTDTVGRFRTKQNELGQYSSTGARSWYPDQARTRLSSADELDAEMGIEVREVEQRVSVADGFAGCRSPIQL